MDFSTIFDILKYVLAPITLLYVKYNEKDKSTMRHKLENTHSKQEIEKLIDLKLDIHKVEIRDIKDDLKRIETKLDKIIDKMSGH